MINLLRIDEHVNIVETVLVWFCFDTNFFNEITFQENSFDIVRIDFFAIFKDNNVYFNIFIYKLGFWTEAHKQRWFSGRILACHAGGPGSIPGRCKVLFFKNIPLILPVTNRLPSLSR